MPFRSMSFQYKVIKMPSEPDSCLYQLAFGKIGFVILVLLEFAKPIDSVK